MGRAAAGGCAAVLLRQPLVTRCLQGHVQLLNPKAHLNRSAPLPVSAIFIRLQGGAGERR